MAGDQQRHRPRAAVVEEVAAGAVVVDPHHLGDAVVALVGLGRMAELAPHVLEVVAEVEGPVAVVPDRYFALGLQPGVGGHGHVFGRAFHPPNRAELAVAGVAVEVADVGVLHGVEVFVQDGLLFFIAGYAEQAAHPQRHGGGEAVDAPVKAAVVAGAAAGLAVGEGIGAKLLVGDQAVLGPFLALQAGVFGPVAPVIAALAECVEQGVGGLGVGAHDPVLERAEVAPGLGRGGHGLHHPGAGSLDHVVGEEEFGREVGGLGPGLGQHSVIAGLAGFAGGGEGPGLPAEIPALEAVAAFTGVDEDRRGQVRGVVEQAERAVAGHQLIALPVEAE